MKKTRIASVFFMIFMALVAFTFTGCNFGKDDFYGTWQSEVFARPSDGKDVRVTFYFSGKSENLTSGNKAYFYEYYENLTDSLRTFWWGTYTLSNNSDITHGDLTLRYMYGVGLEGKKGESTPYDLQKLIDATKDKKISDAGSFENDYKESKRWFDQYDSDNKKCSDVEQFDFKLDGAVAFQGYTQMLCTARSMYSEYEGDVGGGKPVNSAAAGAKKNPVPYTSWGTEGTTRTFYLTKDNGQDYGSSNMEASPSIFTPSLSRSASPSYTEIISTPEK